MGKRLANNNGRALPLAAALVASIYAGPAHTDISTAVWRSAHAVSGLQDPAEIIVDQ